MKHTIEGYIVWYKYEWDAQGTYRFQHWLPDGDDGYVAVGPASIEVEIPDDFNPVICQLANLRLKKQTIQAELTAKLAAVDHEIGKLLALEHKVAA